MYYYYLYTVSLEYTVLFFFKRRLSVSLRCTLGSAIPRAAVEKQLDLREYGSTSVDQPYGIFSVFVGRWI